MYEVDFTGKVRTPEYLKRIKDSFFYRWYMNWRKVFIGIKYHRWWHMKALLCDAVLNKNYF